MKRPAIACVWVASIAATWLLVRGATTEDVSLAPAAKPTVGRDSPIRVARLPALPGREANATLEAPDGAFRDAMAILERDLADGRWGVEDRDRLTQGTRKLTAAQTSELYDVLFPKLNAGTVKSDIDGPPL